jgi:hypothetical protein
MNPLQVVDAINAAIKELWEMLIFHNNILFNIVLAPFKVIAGMGFLYQGIPLLIRGDYKSSMMSWLGIVMVLILFLNNGDGMRKLALVEYAIIKGSDEVIKQGFNQAVGTLQITQNLQGNNQAINEIKKAVDDCLGLSPMLNGAPNPAYTQCDAQARQLVQDKIASGEIKDPTLKGRLLSALSKGNLIGFAGEVFAAVGQAAADASMAIPRLIFAALRSIWLTIGQVALLLAVIAVPFPLAMSFFSPNALIIWHGSFWATGVFMFSMTLVAGVMDFFQSKVGAGLPTFMIEIAVALIAPIVAGVIAVGGGIAVVKALTQAATAVVNLIAGVL